MTTCSDVTLWLDAEGPDDLPAALHAHAAACADCARALRAERAIRDALVATPDDLAPDLEARILRRLAHAAEQSRTRPMWEALSTTPPLAGAFALAAALVVWGDDLWRSLAHVDVARALTSAPGGVPLAAWGACLTLWPLAALVAWGIARGPRLRPRGT